jgi:hypothetical protein
MFNRRFGPNKWLNLGYRYFVDDYDNLPYYAWDITQDGPILGFTWAFQESLRMRNMPTDEKPAAKRGRPRRPAHDVRSNRVVSFLTASELQRLEDIAVDEDRSLSSVVHRIIEAFLKQSGQ